MFCDICDLDNIVKKHENAVINMVNEIFCNFDGICIKHGVQKIETVGKTYMASGGLSILEDNLSENLKNTDPNIRVLKAAIEMMEFIDNFTIGLSEKISIKIGIHYGPCIFGLIGYHKPQFSLIGDTINTTSRVCSTGNKDFIILSESAMKEIKNLSDDYFFKTKAVFMKGKGIVDTYILQRKKKSTNEINLDLSRELNDEKKEQSFNPDDSKVFLL